jgi:glycine/D-amino acid oxidase-like deaminating enzyme
MLEARDICSGATGRNGGHVLETAEEFGDLEEVYGTDAARKILRFRLAHLRELLAVAEEYGLTETAQARKVQFLSVYFNQKGWSEARRRFQRLREGLPEETGEWRLYEREDIPKVGSKCHYSYIFPNQRYRSFLFLVLKESSPARQVQSGPTGLSPESWLN